MEGVQDNANEYIENWKEMVANVNIYFLRQAESLGRKLYFSLSR